MSDHLNICMFDRPDILNQLSRFQMDYRIIPDLPPWLTLASHHSHILCLSGAFSPRQLVLVHSKPCLTVCSVSSAYSGIFLLARVLQTTTTCSYAWWHIIRAQAKPLKYIEAFKALLLFWTLLHLKQCRCPRLFQWQQPRTIVSLDDGPYFSLNL